ncbi:deoxyribonuclease-2-alpha isoform X2 [Myotis myotis]|uniref:Deoxyribonuclease-2-alpha n=1 Tax=Myotis myotis TaxID=51298 RepID=A0A7J7RBE2_MYOMY|nr:deoxyribonuclease-2-alpha isoform X2 [Myotis myotis]KAF6273510.1 deoxyribonuclease 2, lysosomal [Myotis myotis]
MATLSLLLLGALLWVPAGTLTCYGDSGQPVDWFVVYKLPESNRYKYLDAGSGGWRDGTGSMDNLKGAVGRSLLPLYRNTSQPPDNYGTQNSSSRGHTKGVLLLDKDEGFWLIHSVPGFPPPAAYSWPPKAYRYGQTLLCVSFPFDQFSNIGKQLSYTYPNVYAYQLEGVFLKKLLVLEEVVQGHHVLNRPWNSSVTLTSKAGATFQSFAKFGKFGDDLYSGWLAEALGSNLQVQFWQHSPGILPSNCSGAQQVLDVTQVAFPGPAGPTFSTSKDHSKWCVAPEGPWACVGDMNRNCAEEHRGGGTLCTKLPAFWKAFQPLVKAWERCKRRAAPHLQKAQQSI